jgi:hypothetical protein
MGWVSVPENGHVSTGVACSDGEMPNFNLRGIPRSLQGNTTVPYKFFVTVTIHEQFHK